MKYFFGFLVLAVVSVLLIAGRRGDHSSKPPIEVIPDMDRQPKLRPQAGNNFFGDGKSSQVKVEGTIARGSHYEDNAVNTGKITGTTNWVELIPVQVTAQLMARGHERYDINCAPCHGKVGDGKGITTKYAMVAVANFHDQRLIEMTDGEIFNTITHGKNLMGPYGANIDIEDRWAIIAYLRTLQRSRLATIDDVPAAARSSLNK
ncbi:MAG TPA: cytochrome c [Verrucomicrobiae bacterium]